MGVPVAISDGTLYIDVDTDTVGLAYNQEENIHQKTEKIVRNNANIKNFMMASGLMGSYLEGYVVGEATNTKGVSSVSIIKESKERGINIVALSEENKAILNTLSIDKTAKNEIEKALNNGKTVIVPEKSIQYYDWNGTSYITLNPETGEAAYMISGGLCGGESSQDLAMTLFTIIVAVAAIFAIAVFAYFAWSAIAAMIGVALTISEGISILDTCIILLSMAGAIFSITEAGNVGIDAYEYIIDPSVENGSDILRKAVEAGAMFLIFEVAMPRLISSVSAKINFDESGFYKFVTKKWGGKTIKTPPAKPDTDPDLNSDADPDTNPNKRPLGDYWEKIAEKYGQDIVDKLRPFGNDGKRLIEQYGDELVDIIKELSEDDTKLAIQLVKEYGDDAVELFAIKYDIFTVKNTLECFNNSGVKTRLPRTNGYWEGKPGDGLWYSENISVIEITGGEGVPFKNGRPDFSKWSQGSIEFEIGELDGSNSDFTAVYKVIKEKYNLSSNNQAKLLLRELGLTPHHSSTTVIELIPTRLHGNIPHIGSASDLRTLGNN
ncbi:hypothetical protein [uncultured Eubacterium sp.]|uniref:hypothetical protein n=1 Tax=uncultured Eubacterium sp. TaxID=165185 RepID=UPI0026DD5EA0|nr:hypothetical protein [uncultured Eubacterium sp.]